MVSSGTELKWAKGALMVFVEISWLEELNKCCACLPFKTILEKSVYEVV